MSNTYLIYGNDNAAMEARYSSLLADDSNLEIESFNLSLVKDLSDFFNEGISPSLFAQNKVIRIFIKNKLLKNIDKDIEKFETLLTSISSYKQVFFLISYDRWDKNSKKALLATDFIKFIKPEKTKVSECLLLKPWQTKEMKEKIKVLASNYEISFVGRSLDMFVEIVKNDFSLVYREMEKLQVYSMPSKEIKDEDINLIYRKEADVDELLVMIFKKSYKGMNEVLKSVTQNTSNIYTLAILQNRLRQSLQVKSLSEEGLNPYQISKMVGVHSYRIELLLNDLRGVSSSYLQSVLKALSEFEYKAKTGMVSGELILDNLTAEIASLA